MKISGDKIALFISDADVALMYFKERFTDSNRDVADPPYAREKIRAAMKALKRVDDILKPPAENVAQ